MNDFSQDISIDMIYGSFMDAARSSGIATSDDIITKISTGATNPYKFQEVLNENDGNFDKKAGGSFDVIFSPYSTNLDVTAFPHFETPTNLTDPNSLTLNPFNPNNELSLYYAPTGSTLYQNSLTTAGSPTVAESGKEASPSGWLNYGHNIDMAVNGTGQRDSMDFDHQFTSSNGTDVEVVDIRSVGFRAPMVLSGWGYDTDQKPVPADTGNPNIFASGAFRNPNIWKTGPVDLRWDNDRKVWSAGTSTSIFLVKTTNTYNPSSFSYEVQRSASRAQYTRDTLTQKTLGLTDPIHDPEQVAYDADAANFGSFEKLDYTGGEYPHYEAFIIRKTNEDPSTSLYYNLWTDDCQDCGHIIHQCASGDFPRHGSDSANKKILVENPLRQSLNVGDLAFTVKTGRSVNVNTGTFTGGTGTGAAGTLTTDANGTMSDVIDTAGAGYTYGGFAIIDGNIATNVTLTFSGGLTNIAFSPPGGYEANQSYSLSIYPTDATATTESLDIHWILQAEFKSQQVTTHVEGNGGILQTCSTIVQTQGFKSCEWCGEDTTLINNTI